MKIVLINTIKCKILATIIARQNNITFHQVKIGRYEFDKLNAGYKTEKIAKFN